MEAQRKAWNQRQKDLRPALLQPDRHREALELFLHQHAELHSAAMTSNAAWSFPDAVLKGLSDAQLRHIPVNQEHSIAWCFWHMARIEDVTMNLLVGGRSQILLEATGWNG